MNWIKSEPNLNKAFVHYLSKKLDIHPMVTQIIYQKGFTNEELIYSYLYPTLEELDDPFLLNDMRKAIVRIIQAMKSNESIMIFGDYDVDGITATTLLYKALKYFGANVQFRLPLRKEGYGLTSQAVEQVSNTASLIITVDNGSSAHEAMATAKRKGIDVIVTDHHEILGNHPDCHAFINPKRSDNTYPFDGLCGAGVAFKVVQALFEAGKFPWKKHLWDYIEYAAIGTIADMMPLKQENRIICKYGIQKLNNGASPIFRQLFEILRVTDIESSTIGFQIAPLFNSIGRIDDPNKAVRLLTSPKVSNEQIKELIDINKKRKELTMEQYQRIEKKIMETGLDKQKVIVVCDDFHNGIIGIIAARIAENFKKPAIVISQTGTGSARSVQGSNFSIINTIQRCSQYLKKFGGHQAAAGLSIDLSYFNHFRVAIQESAALESAIDLFIEYDSEMPINKIPQSLLEDLVSLEPYGMANEKPIFYSPLTYVDDVRYFGAENQYTKLTVADKVALCFKKQNQKITTENPVDLLYTPNSLQKRDFLIEDLNTH